MALCRSTIPLALGSFVIIAEAYLITTNGCTRAKWSVVGNSPPPAVTIQEHAAKMLSLEAVVFVGIRSLPLRPAFGGEISPKKFAHRTLVWTAMAPTGCAGTGCPICELPFQKAR